MTTETSGAIAPDDDAALFDAMAEGRDLTETEDDTPAETEQVEAEKPAETIEQPVSEAREPEPEQEDPRVAKVRDGLLRELKEARDREREQREMNQRLMAQFEAMRPKLEAQNNPPAQQKPKDFFDYENPFEAIEQKIVEQVSPVLSQFREMQVYNARLTAQASLGAETVSQAEEAFNNAARNGLIDPVEHARINNSPNPFAAAVDWHKRQRVLSETGGDLGAYETKLRERLKSDPAFMSEVLELARSKASAAAPVVSIKPQTSLPSVSKMGAAAPLGRTDDAGDLSDADLYDQLASKNPRRR